MQNFLSCDWGTTSFRLRLIDAGGLNVIAEEISDRGIAVTHEEWLQTGRDDEQRIPFYLSVIDSHIRPMELSLAKALSGLPIIVSGMASSSIGLMNVPYSQLPVDVNGEDITSVRIYASAGFDHDMLIISGLQSDDDVVRGEETQLIGCIDRMAGDINNGLFIFPGTHSKHIRVEQNQITGIKTYMTGELFGLFANHSILKNTIAKNHDLESEEGLSAFKAGVNEARQADLLHSAFKVRTNQLLNKLSPAQNYHYLSGLLIGTELMQIKPGECQTINLFCGQSLEPQYRLAAEALDLTSILRIFPPDWLDEATVRGHYKIAQALAS